METFEFRFRINSEMTVLVEACSLEEARTALSDDYPDAKFICVKE